LICSLKKFFTIRFILQLLWPIQKINYKTNLI